MNGYWSDIIFIIAVHFLLLWSYALVSYSSSLIAAKSKSPYLVANTTACSVFMQNGVPVFYNY